MKKHPVRLTAAAALALAAATASANNLYWLGGTGNLTAPNYYDDTIDLSPVAPTASDTVYFGGGTTASAAIGASAADLSLGRLFVGHNTNSTDPGAPTTAGPGTVNVTAGTLSLTLGAGGAANAGLIVGNVQNGTLNIDNATVSVNQLAVIGYGNNLAGSAAVNITNNGTLSILAGNLNLGDSTDSTTGLPGHVTLSGNINVTGSGADLTVGLRAGSTFTQNTGATTITDVTFVGRNAASNSAFTLAGGTYNTNSVTIADGTATGASFSVTAGTLTVNAGFGAGTGAAPTNTSVTFSGTANVSTGGNMTIGSGAAASNSTLTIKDNAVVQIGTPGGAANNNLFLGRSTASGVTFNLQGGTVTIDDRFLMGTGANPTGVVTNHSAGSLSMGQNWVLADTGGDSTYHFSGGTITTATNGIVGRQKGVGVMNHTGGSATFNDRLRVGDSDAADPLDTTLYGTGTYNISGGSVTANVLPVVEPAVQLPALSIAPAGTGTFRVIGDDATIAINGDVLVNSRSATATGTLAYRLEAGDTSLSTVAATGNATFAAGSVLQLDFNSLEPVQGVYGVLTAADIINDGLVPSLPAGWNYQIVPSTGGKTLRFIAGDLNSNGTIDRDDFALIDRGRAMSLTGGQSGDLNADGTINSEDYALIDQAFGTTNTLSPAFLAARASEFGEAYVSQLIAAVPEPSLAACGLALLPLVRRRPNRR